VPLYARAAAIVRERRFHSPRVLPRWGPSSCALWGRPARQPEVVPWPAMRLACDGGYAGGGGGGLSVQALVALHRMLHRRPRRLCPAKRRDASIHRIAHAMMRTCMRCAGGGARAAAAAARARAPQRNNATHRNSCASACPVQSTAARAQGERRPPRPLTTAVPIGGAAAGPLAICCCWRPPGAVQLVQSPLLYSSTEH
jgi:hypothetical protein